jgi:hypothetical protein
MLPECPYADSGTHQTCQAGAAEFAFLNRVSLLGRSMQLGAEETTG